MAGRNVVAMPLHSDVPHRAKYDATVHLGMATQAGAEIRDSCVVYQLDTTKRAITTVHNRRPDTSNASLTAKIVSSPPMPSKHRSCC